MNVFVSYRRDDSSYVTDRIYDTLVRYCDADRVFRDIDSIKAGSDFRSRLSDAIQQCDLVLAVIGARWSTFTDANGHRRLDDPDDFVRIELETALDRQIPIIPLLIENVRMPAADELPDSLADLPSKQGVVLRRDPDFEHDISRLIEILQQYGLNASDSSSTDSLGFGELGL